ncbi:hypothetical protein [Chamaesiphon sp.]|uniref:hypothetical protein n=1 Tax=Chamaesiphon sp. TaxID=2814140 RepID=UPI003593D0B2
MKTKNVKLESLKGKSMKTLKHYKLDAAIPPYETYLDQTELRMFQLKKYHLISQAYILPIPYICQIYHLLNLKHLETIHKFSLKGLKIGNIGQIEPTPIGGSIKFQTTLEPSLNILRVWRKPTIEVELILHTPYTIELKIPIYHNRQINIVFNMLPLANNAHKLFIDIYSNIIFPKPILQIILHCASCLTLFEDLPYLNELATGNPRRWVRATKTSNRDTMQLFKRFVELYGSSLEQPQSMGAIELRPIPDPAC